VLECLLVDDHPGKMSSGSGSRCIIQLPQLLYQRSRERKSLQSPRGKVHRIQREAHEHHSPGSVPAGDVRTGTPLLLPLLETGDEARVGLDAGALGLDVGEGLVEGHAVVADEVGDDDGGGAGDALAATLV
jgi:hypothetical protein